MPFDRTDLEIAWDHQDVEMEEALWEIANAELEDRTPAIWWDEELKIPINADQLQVAIHRLVADGCSTVQLLQQLRQISELANRPIMPRRDVEAHLQRARKFSDELAVFLMSQIGSFLPDSGDLQSPLTAHITGLEQYLKKSSRRIVDPALERAQEEFTRHVYRHTGGRRHAEVALLLSFVTLKRKTEGSQRMATSRLNARQPLSKKPRWKTKLTAGRSDRGWIKERRIKKSVTTHQGYQPPDVGRDFEDDEG